MTDTPSGETVVVDDSKTKEPVTTPTATPEVNSNDSVVEQLRKEKQQAEMRANQLANQLKAKEEADAAQRAKELEEQNQFKELYEQERAKREAIETEAEAKERQAEIAKAKKDVLGEYSDEVRTLVEEAGMDLADSDEATVAAFKEKVEKISKMVTSTGKVSGNNQPNPNQKSELSGDELKIALQDDKSFHDTVVSRFPGIASMTKAGK